MAGRMELRLGTRGSPMALAQTNVVKVALERAIPGIRVELVVISTVGDRDQKSLLGKVGGKGDAFVGEIRQQLRAGKVHAAMHSLKDMPGNEEVEGLIVGAVLEREAPNDVLVVKSGHNADRLVSEGGVIGTSSVRRVAFGRQLFPKVDFIHFRGGGLRRIEKLDNGEKQELADGGSVGPADALIMAASGLKRLGLSNRAVRSFSADEMLPAIGQGIVAVECNANDWETRKTLSYVDDQKTARLARAERELLWVLNGHCGSPIAGLCQYQPDGNLLLTGAVMSGDGRVIIKGKGSGPADRPRELGRDVAQDLLTRGAAKIIHETMG